MTQRIWIYIKNQKDDFPIFCTVCHCDVDIGSKGKSAVYQHTMEVRPDQQNEAQFLPSCGRIDTAIWMHYMDAN